MPDVSELVRHWGYPAIFLAVVLGNVGVPVPEETILILAGYLVWRGELRLPLVLVVGILSAVVGDTAGYWIGRWYGQGVVERLCRWVQVSPVRLDTMRRFVTRYGPLAVFAGRFIAGVRFMAGPLAGATGLGFLPFIVANVLGAGAFVPLAVGAGYAVGYGFGEYVERIRNIVGEVERVVLAVVIICAGVIVGSRVLRALRRRPTQ